MRVLPVAGPGDGDLWLGGRDVVEELPGVVIFGEVGDTRGCIDSDEVGAVEGAGEVLGYGTAEGRAGVDADLEDVHCPRWGGRVGGSVDGELNHVGAFVLEPEEAGVCEVGGMGPVLEIGRGENSNGELSGVRDDHDPFLSRRVPYYFRVAELGRPDVEDWIGGVGGECIAAVDGVGDVLVLEDAVAVYIFCEGVYCHHTIGLVWEETGGVIGVDDSRARENVSCRFWWKQGYLLVFPVVKIR